MHTTQRGFTLIELLVVIAIVAVLAVTVILTLNPAQLLKQARDSTRSSDLATLKSAISVYLADYPSASLATSSSNCYVHVSSSLAACNTGGRFSTAGTVISTSSLAVNGTGWIPVNFNAISSGSPVSVLPDDPVNNATNFYAYRADTTNLTFELNAKMESAKFISGGPNDMETNDGGNNTGLYEVGSAPGLAL
jgi:prepilin-type N-terminal cleavage/methylation domain-containing protein